MEKIHEEPPHMTERVNRTLKVERDEWIVQQNDVKVRFALYDPFAPIIDRAPLLTVFHKNPKNESRSDAS